MMPKRCLVLIIILLILSLSFTFSDQSLSSSLSEKGDTLTEASLGEKLFFDPILSADHTISCASCHQPAFAFADTLAFSRGVGGRIGSRNTPSIMNTLSRTSFFWDGRASSQIEQAIFPIEHPNEMNLPIAEAIRRLYEDSFYNSAFYHIYRAGPDAENIGLALTAFQQTLETADTPNDRWLNDEEPGMTAAQLRGREVFREKGKCLECHFTPDFTGDEFRNIGLFNGREYNDSGRYLITGAPSDIGKFKVPGLRNIAITAPYMHDGSMKTLREVIDYYDHPARHVPDAFNIDSLLLTPLHLTEQEKQDLEAFLHALTDDRFVKE